MTGLLFTALTLAAYQSGYFWDMLFLTVAICRLQCNRQGIFFWFSLFGTEMILFSQIGIDICELLLFQMIICGTSFIYNLIIRAWRRDPLFFWMELILIVVLQGYFTEGTPATTLMNALHKWIGTYLALRGVLIFQRISFRRGYAGARFIPAGSLDRLIEDFQEDIRTLVTGMLPCNRTTKNRRNYGEETKKKRIRDRQRRCSREGNY